MSDGIDFDFSEMMRLAVDLGDVPDTVAPNVRKAVQVTAHHVKNDWRKASDRTGLGAYAGDITYETKELAHSIVGEIGPTPGDSGSFGLVEDANGGVRSAPQHAGRDAARKNEPDFIKGIMLAAGDIL